MKPEGSEQVWLCRTSDGTDWHPVIDEKNGRHSCEKCVPYLPASRVEALEGRIGELERALRAADIAIEHASRFPRSFYGIIGEAKLTAYRNLARSLAPAEAVEEEKGRSA